MAMHALKAILTSLSTLLLHIALPLLVLASVFTLVFATAHPIKQSLEDAQVYAAFTETISQELSSQAGTDDTLAMPQEELSGAVEHAITAELLQEQVEQAIDATYDWLNGITPQPEFTIDLRESRERFATSISSYAADRLESLPTCSSLDQLQNEIDPLTAECVPPGFDPQAEVETYTQELLNSDQFIPEAQFSSTEIFENIDEETRSDVPATFQQLKQAVWTATAVSVVLALAIFLLAPTRRIGLRRVGLNLTIAGFWLGIFVALSWVFRDVLFSIGSDAAPVQVAVIDAVGLLIDQALTSVAIWAGSFIIVGLVLRFGLARLFHEEDTAAGNSVAASSTTKR